MEEIENKINELNVKINKLSKEREELLKCLKEEYLKLDKVKGLASYIKYMGYPCDLYNSFGNDTGDVYDSFGDIEIKVVYRYGYTDIVGLTEEEFTELVGLL